ncbi:IMP cyclohydrolase / Phosphoribosylaminoimidazolecarboxamide formyltransferase [Lacticaseibacillus rhamnosus LRHMDP2]|uniref:IMP cyclohydrolase / Phosphoribosylaminoimidazolecarboxamide formyltransferase n=1 Tax=Lacticaseibacillus rhamnosus LRHMDP3 TaxID=1203259 RepID=A0AB33XWW8_LACRH|nr:IMP cyclohydrolase / Phosphoribosylaminoimidazolecarboxamide formyltransferase [Lacticaseibacillus rhamnosus LRHMDP2]EKS52305.1 IMP cyclohydrolase / Phosphoribosylaminoimidazolecarboxamide formyltransferase [Lacticaseibacillus rhamnosus LRHMDP3]
MLLTCFFITRSPAQKSACKDLNRDGQRPAITVKATYTPVSDRAGSRSQKNPPITKNSS